MHDHQFHVCVVQDLEYLQGLLCHHGSQMSVQAAAVEPGLVEAVVAQAAEIGASSGAALAQLAALRVLVAMCHASPGLVRSLAPRGEGPVQILLVLAVIQPAQLGSGPAHVQGLQLLSGQLRRLLSVCSSQSAVSQPLSRTCAGMARLVHQWAVRTPSPHTTLIQVLDQRFIAAPLLQPDQTAYRKSSPA